MSSRKFFKAVGSVNAANSKRGYLSIEFWGKLIFSSLFNRFNKSSRLSSLSNGGIFLNFANFTSTFLWSIFLARNNNLGIVIPGLRPVTGAEQLPSGVGPKIIWSLYQQCQGVRRSPFGLPPLPLIPDNHADPFDTSWVSYLILFNVQKDCRLQHVFVIL